MEKSFEQFIEELNILEHNLSKLIENKQINPKIADDLVLIAQQKVKIFLQDFFETLFPSTISLDKNSEFILYSYKSLYGEIPAQTSDKHQLFKRRFNLFSKGKRWSNRTGKKFYDFLDLINEMFSDTPINMLGEFCAKNNIRYLTIKTTSESDIGSENSVLEFPDFEILKKIETGVSGENGLAGYLRNYMRYLVENPSEHQSSELRKVESVIKEINIQKLLDVAKMNSKVNLFLEKAKSVFNISDNDVLSQERFLKAFFTYQLNDLDFDLHLFFPCSTDGVFRSVLMIATRQSFKYSEAEVEKFCKLTTQLKFLEDYEESIVETTKANNEAYIIWKNNYEKEYQKLYTFMVSVENICRSVCTQKEKRYSHVSGRVKTFESFYNKIFIRANESDDPDNIYKKAIAKPHDYFNKIFELIRDLSGVRVILLFQSDLIDIKNYFLDLRTNQDLSFDDGDITFYEQSMADADSSLSPEEKSNRWGYRSLHITVRPGNNRLKLIEYEGLTNVKCEIQFRTVLAHAWADVNHDLEYKNREVIKEIDPELQYLLKEDFIKLSKNLYDNDMILIDIKTKNEQAKLNLK